MRRRGSGRLARIARIARLVLGGLVGGLGCLFASDSVSAATPRSPGIGTADEEETLALYNEGKLLTARTRAQAILDRDPSSIIGHYVLGSVLRDAEGSLPRSRTQLLEARRLFKLQGVTDKSRDALGSAILRSLARTTGHMDDYAGQLELLDEYDREYTPKRPAEHAWPLMKLHRYAEARAFAREGIDSKNSWQTVVGLNALCAIDGEDHDRVGSYESCKRAFDWVKARTGEGSLAVHGYNAALGALGLLRYDEAERFALAGTAHNDGAAANPWRLLAELYSREARADDTVNALREMEAWSDAQAPEYRDQKSAENFSVIAEVLLAAGDAATGLHFIDRALERPDRNAVTSSHPEQFFGGGALLRRALYLLDAELRLERASARGLGDAASEVAQAMKERALAAVDEERIVSTLADEDRFLFTLRPYAEDSLEPYATWLTGDLVQVAGAGVTAAVLDRARRDDASFPEAKPFFDAIDAEIAFAQRRWADAADIAEMTVERLPRAEALLRARLAAVGAEAARRLDQVPRSVGLFERSLALDPGAVRRLGLAIPARVEASGGALAARAADLLRASPRLRSASGAFVVRVEGGGKKLRASLIGASSAVLAWGEVTLEEGESDAAFATRLADEFHRAAFAMKFSLTPTDLRSLDGATTAAQGSAGQVFRDLFGAQSDK